MRQSVPLPSSVTSNAPSCKWFIKTISFRMTAVRATLAGLPAAISRVKKHDN